ncbi:hypothetical protein [Halalkalibacter oceani]|uniref:hypothetical protein n=1 Tax=Halalkalibacter oceani TaxID=1653776 RepID=UPI0033956B03
MSRQEYAIPSDPDELFNDVERNSGSMSYHIIDYTEGFDMDNIQSLSYFVECVGIHEDSVEEDHGTQIYIRHPAYAKRVVIDSSGLGDFYSHGYECQWEDIE